VVVMALAVTVVAENRVLSVTEHRCRGIATPITELSARVLGEKLVGEVNFAVTEET